VTIINDANMNALLALQDFRLIYEGTERDAKIGEGVTENNIANYSFCARFTLTGSTEVARIELELDRDNNGSDLVVQIRSGMNPAAGGDGTLLKQVVVPKEFIPDPKGFWSVPIGLTGLTSGAQYWLAVVKSGDATNKADWIGEASQDGSYPAYYREGESGAWAANNALHFKVFSGASGDLVHGLYGSNLQETYIYSGEDLDKIYRYLPPADGAAGGIRDIITITFDGEYLTDGAVT